ncbi:MAG: outer membrane protein assembly factor BamD, partial [Nitrospirae bacterium]|nr:outer membrane protein assembly factor BamD [Nitrospirota bacterium]
LRIKKCKNLIAAYELMVAKYYYGKGSYHAAIGRFTDLLKEFPEYKRAPEVLYMTALAYEKLNKSDDAIRYLQDLITKYPDSEYSRKAKETLASLKK